MLKDATFMGKNAMSVQLGLLYSNSGNFCALKISKFRLLNISMEINSNQWYYYNSGDCYATCHHLFKAFYIHCKYVHLHCKWYKINQLLIKNAILTLKNVDIDTCNVSKKIILRRETLISVTQYSPPLNYIFDYQLITFILKYIMI